MGTNVIGFPIFLCFNIAQVIISLKENETQNCCSSGSGNLEAEMGKIKSESFAFVLSLWLLFCFFHIPNDCL